MTDGARRKELWYRRVVRLKGGDPFVFGRGGEEAAVIERGSLPGERVIVAPLADVAGLAARERVERAPGDSTARREPAEVLSE